MRTLLRMLWLSFVTEVRAAWADTAPLTVWTNGTEWYIARNREHLRELYRAHCGLELDDEDALGDDGEWSECAADEPIGMWTGEGIGDGELVRLLPREWAMRELPGFLCTTEA